MNHAVVAIKGVGDFGKLVFGEGVVKKVDMDSFEQVRRNGMIAIKLKNDDQLGWVLTASGNDQVMLVTSGGSAIRFKEKDVRPMGRATSGVRGIKFSTTISVRFLFVPSWPSQFLV